MDDTKSVVDERKVPSPEVLEKPVRRRFRGEYKAKIVAEADACTESGMLGELLRREGLYLSHLSTWRRQGEDRSVSQQTASKMHGSANTGRTVLQAAIMGSTPTAICTKNTMHGPTWRLREDHLPRG